MRTTFAVLLAALTFTSYAQAQTLRELLKTTIENWNKPTEPFKIIGNIYYVGTNGLSSFLVTSPQGHVLIDTTMPETASQIEANIQKLGFKLTDVKYLVNTHAHMDHTGGFAQLKKSTGAQMVSARKTSRCLRADIIPGTTMRLSSFRL
nr:class B beta-lactamase, subclass B3 [uncultured bacterium]